MKINPVDGQLSWKKYMLVYPVYSRRSRGLSIGINLFPDKKRCSFDCPYCELFPFVNNARFETGAMEKDLLFALANAKDDKIPVKDICFSGNGEPSMSPDFPAALEKVVSIRDRFVPRAEVVLITNGAGLLNQDTFDLLTEKARAGLVVWLKIDAATEDWFKRINRPLRIDFSAHLARIRDFAASAPFIVQTMICKIDKVVPPSEEEKAWVKLITELAKPGNMRSVQIYGKARPAPEDPLAEAANVSLLENRAKALTASFKGASIDTPVEVFP